MFKRRGKWITRQERQNGVLDLTQMENGKPARVLELRGGEQFVGKLKAMGVIPGTVILKKTTTLMNGPIVLEKGSTQFAIGYEMARNILVEPLRD